MFNHRIGDDLELRLPEERDAEPLFALFGKDMEYLTYWNDWPKRIQTLGDCRAFVSDHRRSYAEERSIPAAMIYEAHVVGISRLRIHNKTVVKNGGLDYWIGEDYQGKGIVTRSCRSILSYAFDELELNRVSLRFKHESKDNENRASRRVAERLGFTREGVQRQGGVARGRFMDMVCYSLLSSEWQEMQRTNTESEQSASDGP